MRNLINRVPVLRSLARFFYFGIIAQLRSFPGSEDYWKRRYRLGGTSGAGSFNKLAQYKSEVLNNFVKKEKIRTIIEYGCGDGNQLILANYPAYLGFDISPEAISLCKELFSEDGTKTFKLMHEYANEKADLTLSLGVIYHLVEDEIFEAYMRLLFDSSSRFVIIYSSNSDQQERLQAAHVRHREFTTWIERKYFEWRLIQHIPNRYSYAGDDLEESFADFYIYKKH